MLIAAGADVNVKDQEGKTALMYAREKRNKELQYILINAGAIETPAPSKKTEPEKNNNNNLDLFY